MVNHSNTNIKVLVLFEELEELHLYKEIGMIPWYGKKILDWSPTILSLERDDNTHLDIWEDIEIIKIKKRSLILKWIKNNATRYDMLIYIGCHTHDAMKLFKRSNPKAIVYMKLDLDHFNFERKYLNKEKSTSLLKKLKTKVNIQKLKKRYKFADLVSVETKAGLRALQEVFKGDKQVDKFFYMPNGFDDSMVKKCNTIVKNPSEKENIMITVGRLGTKQKNTELLLDAVSKIDDIKDWKFFLIGSLADGFDKTVNDYFERYPKLREHVIFLGNIKDKCLLNDYYNKAKVFILSSRDESFGLVLNEALYFRNYIVSTDVGAAQDITNSNDPQIGRILNSHSSDELSKVLSRLIESEDSFWTHGMMGYEEHINSFLWESSLMKLNDKINEFMNAKL